MPGGCLNVFKTTMQGPVSEFEKIRVFGHFESLPTYGSSLTPYAYSLGLNSKDMDFLMLPTCGKSEAYLVRLCSISQS